ncbi:MAG: Txe/YoeB family addiction module toxin [Bacteroidota bacterium]
MILRNTLLNYLQNEGIGFSQKAFKDFLSWSIRDKKIFLRLAEIILEITRDPFNVIGKREPLKHQFKGLWSRRITQEHRIVYEVTDKLIIIVSCGGHYTK